VHILQFFPGYYVIITILDIMNIRESLSELRKTKEIKQKDIADSIGVERSKLSRFEKGEVNIPIEKIELYAEYLGMELRLLIKK